ncbi:hypothetical protein [Modestobacter excelsi]|uniref:hypothetical protein n=1 Tax=Modestobacter excelsi TaxID=2213161 RepID=UPI00110CF804|nr:hypothetical protein [Modestobacter excelsi]
MVWTEHDLGAQVDDLRGQFDTVMSVSAGDDTEDLVRYITSQLDNDSLDQVEVVRDLDRRGDLASEPITVAALVAVTGVTVVTIGRIIERWLENRRQHAEAKMLITTYQLSKEAGDAYAALASRHADVSIEYQLADPGSVTQL